MKFWRGISGYKLRPDANSYSSIMACCLKNDRNQQVIGLAERMRQDEIALKTVTLNTLLSAYVHMNDWEKVKFLYLMHFLCFQIFLSLQNDKAN